MSIAKTRAFGSSAKSMSSRTVSSFWNEQASATCPGTARAQREDLLGRQRLDISSAGAGLPRSTSFSVSPRSPRRSVSSGITSSGGMLPRLTVRPEVLHEPGLRRLRRRLEDESWSATRARSRRSAPCACRRPWRKMPALPPSRASVITFHAPASFSSPQPLQPTGTARTRPSLSFEPTSERTVKSRAKSAISSSLRSRGISIVPSLISACSIPSSFSHCLYSSNLPLHVDDLEERPADHDRLALQARPSLRLQVLRDVAQFPSRA